MANAKAKFSNARGKCFQPKPWGGDSLKVGGVPVDVLNNKQWQPSSAGFYCFW